MCLLIYLGQISLLYSHNLLMAHSALVFAQLDAAASSAPPLHAASAWLLDTQSDPGSPLPSFDDVCRTLRVPAERTANNSLMILRLPHRILQGTASDHERGLWRAYATTGLHEWITRELVEELAERIQARLGDVVLSGLSGRADLNGQWATVIGRQLEGGRIPVRIVATGECIRVKAFNIFGGDGGLPVVLEVGAGRGALAHHLSRRLYGFARVVATDSGRDLAARCCGAPASAANAATTTTSSSAASCSASSSPVAAADVPTGAFAVERLDAEAALSAHAPRIVLCSWMPSGIDWTRAMRACPSVHEYLLVGEPDGSTCGDGWATWGQLFDGYEEYGLDEESEPPFKEDGFVRAPCDEVSRYQRCRFDSALHASAHHSALSLR